MLFGSSSTHTDRAVTLKGETVTVHGHLKELSVTGIAVSSEKKGAIGTRLEVIFEIPAEQYIQEISAFGYIKRVHNTENGDYYLSIEFEPLDQQQTNYIKDFLAYKERLKKLGQKPYRISNP